MSSQNVHFLILSPADHSLSFKQDAVKIALQKRRSKGELPLLVFVDDVHIDSPGRDRLCMWLLELGSQGLLQAQFLSSDPAAYTHLSSRKPSALSRVALHVLLFSVVCCLPSMRSFRLFQKAQGLLRPLPPT